MNEFTAGFLTELTAGLTEGVLNAASRRIQTALMGDEATRALRRCVQAGLVALLAQATTGPAWASAQAAVSDRTHLHAVFSAFFNDPDVARELALLLRGRTLDVDELRYLFGQAGYDAATLPGLDFETGVRAFEVAFGEAAVGEPALQGVLQTSALLEQTELQGAMLAEIQTMVAALKQAPSSNVGVQAGQIYADNVVNGTQVHVTIHNWGARGQLPVDDSQPLRVYCRELAKGLQHLPLRGIDVGASDPTSGQQQLDLAQVYIALDTEVKVPEDFDPSTKVSDRADKLAKVSDRATTAEDREMRPLRALEAVVAWRWAVILGDPGSGKSTFVNHLAYALARHQAEPQAGWLNHLPDWLEAEDHLVPIRVVLRDFVRWLPQDVGPATPRHLWDFIAHRLQMQNLEAAIAPLRRVLENGDAIVLLDGLDEIPDTTRRAWVRDAVVAFGRRYADNRLLVTCRTLSYQDVAWQLPDVPSFPLASFDEDKIKIFIHAWYAELARLKVVHANEAEGLARRLQEAVRRPDLWRLAPNPLLLTVMALVHTHRGRLPEARALLYEETVDILLWRWAQLKTASTVREVPALRRLLREAGRGEVDLKRVLGQLAFESHREGGAGEDTMADIGELRLQKALAALHPDKSRDWACGMIEVIKLRAGLLVEREPEHYGFPHRTFQEYLAGAHLAADGQFARRAAALAKEDALWREVILLAVGRLVYLFGDMDKPLALVGELCGRRVEDTASAWRRAWLAGEVLLEAGLNRVRDSVLGQDLAARVQERLAVLVDQGKLSAIERAAAGRVLAKLGDLRPGVGVVQVTSSLTLPDIVWCEVPAGSFTMGSEGDPQAYDDEKPQHVRDVPRYWISRYPITNAQFTTFVEAGGYADPAYWTDGARVNVWKGGKVKAYQDNEPRVGPHDYGTPYNLPNHPVVGVTWYEAVAFCNWLTEQMRKVIVPLRVWREGKIVMLHRRCVGVTLPSEIQWEKAARGPDGRIYPWGDEPDPERVNYYDTGIGTTSAVGAFPGGVSPYGVLDMSGNVVEWCATKWQDDYSDYRDDNDLDGTDLRVVRGGSFNLSDVWLVRCAFRYRFSPDLVFNDYGVRVALVSPFFSEL